MLRDVVFRDVVLINKKRSRGEIYTGDLLLGVLASAFNFTYDRGCHESSIRSSAVSGSLIEWLSLDALLRGSDKVVHHHLIKLTVALLYLVLNVNWRISGGLINDNVIDTGSMHDLGRLAHLPWRLAVQVAARYNGRASCQLSVKSIIRTHLMHPMLHIALPSKIYLWHQLRRVVLKVLQSKSWAFALLRRRWRILKNGLRRENWLVRGCAIFV